MAKQQSIHMTASLPGNTSPEIVRLAESLSALLAKRTETSPSARMLTETETCQLAVEAAVQALTRFSAMHPLPSCVSTSVAAEMLGVSKRTVERLKLPRNALGKIPYEAVLSARSAH